jgi:hypothetical protein
MTLRCHTAVMVAEAPPLTHISVCGCGSFVTRLSYCIDIRVILYVNSEIQRVSSARGELY